MGYVEREKSSMKKQDLQALARIKTAANSMRDALTGKWDYANNPDGFQAVEDSLLIAYADLKKSLQEKDETIKRHVENIFILEEQIGGS